MVCDVDLDKVEVVSLGPKSVLWVAFCLSFCWETDVEGTEVRDGPKSADMRAIGGAAVRNTLAKVHVLQCAYIPFCPDPS